MVGLQGQTAVITGGTKGIGEALALRLARAGVNVVVAGRSADNGEKVAQQVTALGGKGLFVQMDARSHESVAHLVRAAESEFGGIDHFINNGGIDHVSKIEDEDPAAVEALYSTNVMGYVWGMKYALPALRRRGGGTIINVSSVAAAMPTPMNAVYCSSKASAAVDMLTRCVAVDVEKEPIRVISANPYAVRTDMGGGIAVAGKEAFGVDDYSGFAKRVNPSGREESPDEVAQVIEQMLLGKFNSGDCIAIDAGPQTNPMSDFYSKAAMGVHYAKARTVGSAQTAAETLSDAAQVAKEKTMAAAQQVSSTAQVAKEKTMAGAQTAAETLSDAAQVAKEKTMAAAQQVSSTAQVAKEKTMAAAQQVSSTAQVAYQKVAEVTKAGYDTVAQKMSELTTTEKRAAESTSPAGSQPVVVTQPAVVTEAVVVSEPVVVMPPVVGSHPMA
eukprot:jgi/Chlat1/976/Chrsp108S01390